MRMIVAVVTTFVLLEGGVSQRVTKGDFVMIPEGVPHYITEANPHVIFIAIEFPRPRAAQMPSN